ncbi:MAG TPA: aspartate aminotransferase family protein [Thermoanaerobaculia bacterium]|nr:aspartate aminotransferase family protein [Thermoanaerobaculia bacterium]
MAHRFPEGHVFYRRLDRAYPLAVRAEGAWIVDEEGRRYLDASGGAAVANLGHDLGDLAEAVAAEIRTLGYVNGTQFTHRAVEELSAELCAVMPGDLDFAYFLSSGSEAIEAAVKLARQFWLEAGRPEKWKVISRVPSYHGNTLAALALSGREHYRRIYGPLLLPFPRIPAPDPYRDAAGPGTTGEALEAEILRQGPETVAAFVAEPIGGAAGGAVVPPPGYWPRVAEVCRRHDVLLIADEVLCGMGRTGRWLAAEHFDLVPDVVVLGKGLNAGAVPLSALVVRRGIVEALAAGSGAFNHAQTYSHHPALCAAGLATVRRLKGERLVERAAALEAQLFAALEGVAAHPRVGQVRGRGMLAALEFVADRATGEPFPRSRRVTERVVEQAFANGLILWSNTGHVDGERGDLVLVAPPLDIEPAEIQEIGRRLELTLSEIAWEDS